MKGPLHVGLIAQGGAGWMGGTEYTRNLLRAIAAASAAEGPRTSLIRGERQKADWEGLAEVSQVAVGKRKRPLPLFGRFLGSSNKHFFRAIEAAGCDFLYPFTYDNQYNVDVTLPLGAPAGAFRWAGWIPDFQHRHLPQLFSEKEISKRDRGIELVMREAPRIVLSSRMAADDLRRFYPAAAAKAEVLTFATFPRADWYTDYDAEDLRWLPERFFLVSNQFWKHKNHLVLFEALRLLRDRGVTPSVVCTGEIHDFRDPAYSSLILQSLHRFGVAGQVLLVGLVPRRTQIEMMRRSLAVVQPSLFEGWSTVVEDSRVFGKPCLLSDIPVHKEQNPPGGHFFDPHSAESLAGCLAQAWETLSPGPDAAREEPARVRAEARIAEVGREFLAFAARAMNA